MPWRENEGFVRIMNSKNMKLLLIGLPLLWASGTLMAQDKRWSLQECLDYALENNIQLKEKAVTTASSKEDVLQQKSALFPSVSFSTSQSMNYRPFSKQTTSLEGGTMTFNTNAVSYNGSYGINAQWTVWNGGRNRLNIKDAELTHQQNELAETQQANSIQEQVARLYVQILYENEAIRVCQEILKASEMQVERAKEMVAVGSLAKVEQVQLEAQVAQDRYSLISAQSQLADYTLQLKQLLEIHDGEAFLVRPLDAEDSHVTAPLASQEEIYQYALENRPEIKSMKLGIERSKVSLSSARAGYMPTISLNGGLGTSNASAQVDGFGVQVKNNLAYSMGLSVSVPIYDNRAARTNIRKAKYSRESAELQLQEAQKQLYSTIESYFLDATNSQQQYLYAKKNVESMQESYNLTSEQFHLGLKNIVELTTGKNNLLQAQQQLLESKYNALYNIAMLNFYHGKNVSL